MNVTLIRIDAQDASGAAVPVRLASHDMPEACHLGGEQWEPALSSLPDFALDFFGGAFSGQITAPRTAFAVATTGLAAFGQMAATRARFADARVRIWVGDITSAATADLGPLALRFDGRLTSEPQIDNATRTAQFDAAVQDSWADKPLLALFAGTDGIEGPADLTGQVKPLVLGNARFAGGVLIDRVDNVWMVSSGPVQAVNVAYDRLASLGTSGGNFDSLAALKAASIPNGSWGTCLAQGLVRFGAPPDGRVSFDVSGNNSGTGGYVRRAGAMIRRLAELAGGTVNAASLTALDTARPFNLQLQLGEQTTARQVIASIADSVGAVAGVSLRGELFAQALAIGTPSDTLAPDDSGGLRVASAEELPKAAPNWRLSTEAELTFEVHSSDEAAFAYRWQGEYSAARVYRRDDVVTSADGASWAFIGSTPAAGQALPIWPTTANAHWENFTPPVVPEAIGLESGATRNVPRGTYAAGTTYVRGDSVLFAGSSYQLIVASSTGNPPPDVARWALLANAGSGPAGADGLPGLTLIVSNEAHVVATAADGSGGSYGAAGGQMRLLRGTDVLTPTFSIAAATPATGWITINSSTGVYTVSDPGVDLATATIRASWAGVNYDRTYTLAKTKQGVTGPRLALVADNQAFTFTDGAANPGSQTITLTALLNNLSGTATWSTTPAVTLGGTGNTRTLSVANFGTNRQVTVEATLGGITDRITIVRLERDVSAPANANRVPFSRFEGGRGWATGGDVAAAPVLILNDGRYNIASDVAFTSAGQSSFLFNFPRFPVVPGERFSVSSLVQVAPVAGPAPSFWQLYLEYYNSAGGIISNNQIATGSTNESFSQRFAGFASVPANARSAMLVLQAVAAGAGTMRILILEPMVTSAAAGQTVHPPFSPGPNAVDGATRNTGALNADGLNAVDAGGPLLIGELPTDKAVPGLRNSELVPSITAAANQAAAANASAFAANTAISVITSDGILSRDEKPEIRKQRDDILNEYPSIRARAVALSVSVANYDTAYNNFNISHPAWDLSGATDTPIDRAAFNFLFTEYYARRQIVLDGIALEASRRATWANVTGSGRPADNATRNTGLLNADGLDAIDAGGPLFIGQLPPSKAEPGLINANVPLGSNAVVNSEFTRGKFGWRWQGGLFESEWGVNLPGWHGQRNVMWARVLGVWASGNVRDLSPDALWSGADTARAPLFAMPVVQGDRIAATVLAAPHRCTFQLFILFFDGAGAFIPFAPSATGGTPGGGANGNPANFTPVVVIDNAPENARWAIPMMRLLGTGESDPFIFFTEPMLSKVAAGQTVAPRYSPGRTDPNADVTATVSGPGDLVMQFRADLTLLSPLPLTADYQLGVAGASPLTSGVNWSVSVVSGTFAGAAPSIVGAGTGQLRINSQLTSPEATLRITPSVAGRASPPFVVTVRRQVAPPSLAPLTTINSGTFAQAHDTPIQITLPSTASSVSLTAVADLLAGAFAPPGGIGVEGKWQRETSPGTWADVGSAQSASPQPEVFETEIAPGEFVYSATPGSITCNRTASGLTPGSIQRFRFVARVSSGSVRLITFVGNASATA